MLILGLETSCDETASCVLETQGESFLVRSNVVSSQVKLHAQWGGVVPNLAAREHLKNILPIINQSLKEANIKPTNLDLIAVTNGPGLIPALLIGTTTAKTLAYLWQKPLIGIHHIEGHIYANFISEMAKKIRFPLLALVVSGGHTQLILMPKHLRYTIIGETVDDAVGEAFDKVARILDLGYPGGPIVSKLADSYSGKKKFKISLPRPMLKSPNFNFSFSGLKTAVLYATKKEPQNLKNPVYIGEMCHEFQSAVLDVLVAKTLRAAKKYNPQTILLAGGVSANVALRQKMALAIEQNFQELVFLAPDLAYSMDNAAMIATAGYFRWKNLKNRKTLEKNWQTLKTDANLKLSF